MIANRLASALLISLLWGCSSSGSGGGASGGSSSGGTTASGGSSGTTGGTTASGGTSSGGSAGQDAGSTGGATGDGGINPVVEIQTSLGPMTIELDATRMPITTKNFLEYVDSGFYTDTLFHRVIVNFVIQGGGYTSGLVQKSTNPPIELETSPEILHDYGVISMARTTDPNSATSQFFVVNAAAGAHTLDGQYAAFGHMTSGKETLDAITQVATHSVGSFDDVPVDDVVITSATRK